MLFFIDDILRFFARIENTGIIISSANNTYYLFEAFNMSFMHPIGKNGAKTNPCGKLQTIFFL